MQSSLWDAGTEVTSGNVRLKKHRGLIWIAFAVVLVIVTVAFVVGSGAPIKNALDFQRWIAWWDENPRNGVVAAGGLLLGIIAAAIGLYQVFFDQKMNSGNVGREKHWGPDWIAFAVVLAIVAVVFVVGSGAPIMNALDFQGWIAWWDENPRKTASLR